MIRLDIYLATKYPEFSRASWQKYIRKVGVKVNGKKIKKSSLKVTDEDKLVFPKPISEFIVQPVRVARTDFPTLFESKNFVVFDKPPFVKTEDMMNGVLSVHRLDKDTTGVLVAAKNIQSQAALQVQWQKRGVKKTYVALVRGKLKPKEGMIEAPIFRSQHDRKKMSVSSHGHARKSITKYKVKEYLTFKQKEYTLVQFYPITGRTHQIRVHAASIAFPIVGDKLYGDQSVNKIFDQAFKLRRQFLHARELSIENPDTQKRQKFTSKLPKDLESILLKLQDK